jgi:hypothetical protein
MGGYTKRDREACIERAGGVEEARADAPPAFVVEGLAGR